MYKLLKMILFILFTLELEAKHMTTNLICPKNLTTTLVGKSQMSVYCDESHGPNV